MTTNAKQPRACIRLLASCNFVIPWEPWRGLTLGDVVGADPDAALALQAFARKVPCPPLLARAIGVMAQLRKLQLAGRFPRPRRPQDRRARGRNRFVAVQL